METVEDSYFLTVSGLTDLDLVKIIKYDTDCQWLPFWVRLGKFIRKGQECSNMETAPLSLYYTEA